ncbi:MAG: exonuclease subunit SbcD [Colwellia sp.]
MRIIHTSDWHLGQYFYGKSRAYEHQQFLSWLIKQVKKHNVDAIIVAGDIFDTGTPPSYAREMYFNFIGEMQALDCQLVILAGNHDSVAMLGESKALLSSLSTHVITHVNANISTTDIDTSGVDEKLSPQVFTLNNKKNKPQAILCAIPFIRPRDIIKSQVGQSASEKQQNLQQAISQHYQTLYTQAQKMADALAKGQSEPIPIIATGHLTALGVTLTDSVRDIYIGSLEAFPCDAFPPADYIALGHIHRAQKVGKTEHIRYCGSPIPLSFDEAKQNKRILMVDFMLNKLSLVTDIIVPCFQPMAMIKTTLDDLHNKVSQVVTALDENDALTGKIWLDIEIESGSHLNDLQQRVSNLVDDFPVEILLVRRCKESRKLLQQHQQHKATLNELTLDDVFESRLAQEPWKTEQELKRKQSIQVLFKQTIEQVLSADQTDEAKNKFKDKSKDKATNS